MSNEHGENYVFPIKRMKLPVSSLGTIKISDYLAFLAESDRILLHTGMLIKEYTEDTMELWEEGPLYDLFSVYTQYTQIRSIIINAKLDYEEKSFKNLSTFPVTTSVVSTLDWVFQNIDITLNDLRTRFNILLAVENQNIM